MKVIEESVLQHKLGKNEFGVECLSDLVKKIKNNDMPNNWLVWSPSNYSLHILHPPLSQECLEVKSYLNINDHCNARAFLHNTQVPSLLVK